MNPEEFEKLQQNRKNWMISTLWPLIQERLKNKMTPEQIASELSKSGYWGLNGSRIGVNDIYFIWKEAMMSQAGVE